MAIAIGADVHGKRDVEARAAVDNGLCILGDLAVEHVGRGVIAGLDAVWLHAAMQRPQPTQRSWSMAAT